MTERSQFSDDPPEELEPDPDVAVEGDVTEIAEKAATEGEGK